ncbi:MAG: diaminopimelate decarboxylase [Syntrophothermus sp.]
MHLYGTMRINSKGHLEIGGCDTVDLARDFGTPLYILDEAEIRKKCRLYRSSFEIGPGESEIIYAGKTLMTMAVARIIDEEGLSLDVVSGGELYTALAAGFPGERIYFNGNNKSREELRMAIKAGIRRVIVDNRSELQLLDEVARELHSNVKILLRITPGVEAHTHEYIQTGQLDSKFGIGLANGQALAAAKEALGKTGVTLAGFQCHIGSQIFNLDSYRAAVGLMLDFVAEVARETGFICRELDLGGGLGIRYNDQDTPASIEDYATALWGAVEEGCRTRGLKLPKLLVEPGRSLMGEAGTTLYTVGSIKAEPGIRKYVAIDGGMTDNPRVALYGAVYEAVLANRAAADATEVVNIAGKCCESGDMLIWDIALPSMRRGDLLAVFCTGAYNYSMSSNYNRLLRPAMVLVQDGEAHLIVKRETYDDLLRNDIIPKHLERQTRPKSMGVAL